MKNIEDLIKSHRSVRRYHNQDISVETIEEMLEVAQHASSSHFVQAYSVILVTKDEVREEIARLSNNIHVKTSSKFLVFCADMERLNIACDMHGKMIESQSAENLLVATIDVSLVAQNFTLVAESRGYGICFIGGIRNSPLSIGELLGLPTRVFPLFGITIGVPDEDNEVKPRLPLKSILHINKYESVKYKKELAGYDEIMKEYYALRSSNQKEKNWTKSMADYMSVKNRENIKMELMIQGFNME